MPTRRDFLKRSAMAGAGTTLPDWNQLIATYHLLAGGSPTVGGDVTGGVVTLTGDRLAVGAVTDLTGEWLFKPSYALSHSERPELGSDKDGYHEVAVPQLLSRVRWWLDDSEDFDDWEQARLDLLGFDTERSDDGWYRLFVDTDALPAGRRLFLHFDGVAMVSRAYLNGRELGSHQGMFSRFGFDLTPHLQEGRNVLSLFVSMEKIAPSEVSLGEAVTVNLTASKVLTMSKGMYGPLSPNSANRAYDLYGIWQPARLIVRGEAMIDDAWFVPALDGADVHVEARALGAAHTGSIEATWTDLANGTQLASTGPKRIQLSDSGATETLSVSNLNPHHWTPADPHLYRMEVTLRSDDDELLDRVTHDVGFRTFEASGNRLLLNGEPYWLRGANHLPYGKNPWDPELPRKLISLMHEGNQRVTRTHCTPWNESWLSAADEIGLGVSIEGIRPWALVGNIGGPPENVYEHWLMEHEDVVRRCRNHPSVLIWTIGNEMMLRDARNLEKWTLLSGVVKLTRRLDPTRPIVCSSDYARDPEFYQDVLEPNGIDDGDIDDIHRYNGWYGDSNFVRDSRFDEPLERNRGRRPFIGQEMSSGYPDLDSGLPVLRYTRDLVVPQAWVGKHAYPGNDPAVWLNEHRDVTKRWAEQLRFQRTGRTAGFMLFANECWYHHSFDSETVSPYPVHDAVRFAWAPIGLAVKTPRRRFYAGSAVETSVFVTNDDEQFRDHESLTLRVDFVDQLEPAAEAPSERVTPSESASTWQTTIGSPNTGGPVIASTELGRLDRLAYYDVAEVPVRLDFPAIDDDRRTVAMVIRLMSGTDEISRTVDDIELFRKEAMTDATADAAGILLSAGPELERFVESSDLFREVRRGASEPVGANDVVLLGSSPDLQLLERGRWIREWVEAGGTAIAFSPGKQIVELFPEYIDLVREDIGEYADPSPAEGTPLVAGVAPMDLKWWGRRFDDRTFVAAVHHRLKDSGHGRVLVRFIPSHGYVREEVVPGLFRSVLSELPLGRGRLWICDLDLEASLGVDPAAELFTRNLLLAAADPQSTGGLTPPLTHEELLERLGIGEP